MFKKSIFYNNKRLGLKSKYLFCDRLHAGHRLVKFVSVIKRRCLVKLFLALLLVSLLATVQKHPYIKMLYRPNQIWT